MGNRVYVANISFNASEKDLYDFFASKGKVQTTRIMIDRESGRSRGFGFVTMATDQDAAKVIQEINGQDFFGRRLFVNEARERESAPTGEARPSRPFTPRPSAPFRTNDRPTRSSPDVSYVSPRSFGGDFGPPPDVTMGRSERRERASFRRARPTERFEDFE